MKTGLGTLIIVSIWKYFQKVQYYVVYRTLFTDWLERNIFDLPSMTKQILDIFLYHGIGTGKKNAFTVIYR